jgi:hypothetical protein
MEVILTEQQAISELRSGAFRRSTGLLPGLHFRASDGRHLTRSLAGTWSIHRDSVDPGQGPVALAAHFVLDVVPLLWRS